MRKILLWTSLTALFAVTAPAEFKTAEAVGISQWVAWTLPLAVDSYVVLAVMATLDVLPALLVLWASVTVGMLHRVSTDVEDPHWDAYALAAVIATVLTAVLWRIHCVDVHLEDEEAAVRAEQEKRDRQRVEQELADEERRATILARQQAPSPIAVKVTASTPKARPATKTKAPPRDQARLIIVDSPGVSDAELARRHNGSDRFWAGVKKEMAADMKEISA